jgi:hypothetical protein
MFRILLIGTFSVLLACSSSKEFDNSGNQAEKYEVVISATTTQAYCGGVSPTEEMLKEFNTPSPAPNVKLYLRKGDSNNIKNDIDYELTTNDSGRVETSLPQGTYSIVFENKKDLSTYDALLKKYGKETSYQTPIDTNCLTQFFVKTNAVLVVGDKKENAISVNRRIPCQSTRIPCSKYKGELPPSVKQN